MKINGLKIAICQMESVPLNPIANARYMCNEINRASMGGSHVIVFPEVCIHDYLNGDAVESLDLLRDIEVANKMVCEATANGSSIIAIFGSLFIDWHKRGEDGRVRKHNVGIAAQFGRMQCKAIKTLQPKYRMFFDSRHFFSGRQLAEEISWDTDAPFSTAIKELIKPFVMETPIGQVSIGVTLCEDMWKDDYHINPAAILAEKGADIIFNLSASPWTWRKNEKRHRVVKSLFPGRKVVFVYVNKTGFNQQGKSGYPYDGASTAYDQDGEIIFEVPQYFAGTKNFICSDSSKPIRRVVNDDSEQLYLAARCACEGMLRLLPSSSKILVGLSGGIDSAVVASLFTDVAGPSRVVGVNMPYKSMNSDETKEDARYIAHRLGIEYIVRPIDAVVDAMVSSDSDFDPDDRVNFGNLQALARMLELNKLTKTLRYRGVFTCNSNKVEAAFGYGTLYADIAGFFGPLLDLVKREVYQLGDYLNEHVFGNEVIPRSVFKRNPSAELEAAQKDPFDYGSLTENGYHDQMVRALTEFRWDWADFIEHYLNGTLEGELKLPEGRLKKLFATGQLFLMDLQLQRRRYETSYFKRLQCPPNVIYTKRGFGSDLQESLHSAPASQRFQKLAAEIK